MIKWTEETLKDAEATIKNAQIVGADLRCDLETGLTVSLKIVGKNWTCSYDSLEMGKLFKTNEVQTYKVFPNGVEGVMRLFDTLGATKLSDLVGRYIRVVFPRESGTQPIQIVGHLIEDKWFDAESFYNEALVQKTLYVPTDA